MKKIASILIMIICGFCACFGTSFLHAFATDDTKEYLIDANFESQASAYNISSDEIYDSSPFDAETKTRMTGKSVMVHAEEEQYFVFDKTFNTNSTELASNQSIYLYLLFNAKASHTLKITASDGLGNEIVWTLSKQTIEAQMEEFSPQSSRKRYGWMLVELPASQNITVNTLRFEYTSDEMSDLNKYSRVLVYAPYVASKSSSDVAFVSKQNYYNFAVKFGTYKYVNDALKINNITNIIEYCYLGEVDYLKYPVNTYKLILRVKNIDEDKTQAHTLVVGLDSFEYVFEKTGNYELTVSLYEDNLPIMGYESLALIEDFVGIYLSSNFADMQKDETYVYTIVVSSELINSGDVVATSSNTSVASVSVDGNKLYVKTHKKGNTKITISVLGERAGQESKTYSAEYTAVVTEPAKGVNWWLMGGTAIFLIVASIVVYTIMVRRRLIKGRYPKY